MYGWRLKKKELKEACADEWVSFPVGTKDGTCDHCGSFIHGKGIINNGVDEEHWYEDKPYEYHIGKYLVGGGFEPIGIKFDTWDEAKEYKGKTHNRYTIKQVARDTANQ